MGRSEKILKLQERLGEEEKNPWLWGKRTGKLSSGTGVILQFASLQGAVRVVRIVK